MSAGSIEIATATAEMMSAIVTAVVKRADVQVNALNVPAMTALAPNINEEV